MLKKLAFSLTELIVTVAIIGVIASMTIPTMMTKINNARNTAVIKEDYAILQQVLRIAHHDGIITNYTTPDDRIETIKLFENHFLPHMRVMRKCYGEEDCWSDKVLKLNGQIGDAYQDNKGCGLGSITFHMFNGSSICMDDLYGTTITNEFGVESSNYIDLAFYIDVNGSWRKPNTYGKDIFIVIFNNNEQGRMLPAGNDKTDEDVEKDCSAGGTGIYCLSYFMRKHGFRIKDLKLEDPLKQSSL